MKVSARQTGRPGFLSSLMLTLVGSCPLALLPVATAAAEDMKHSPNMAGHASSARASVEGAEASPPSAASVEAHITRLHTELRISQAQEDLWKPVAQVMRDNEKTMDRLHQVRADQAPSMTAVDDVKSYAAIAEAHAEGLKKFVEAFERLYGGLSPEQQKTADQLFNPFSQRAGRHTKPERP